MGTPAASPSGDCREIRKKHLCIPPTPTARCSDLILPNFSSPHQPLKPDRERHQPGDPGNGDASRIAIGRLSVGEGFVVSPALSARAKIQCVGDLLVAAHARASCPAAVIAGLWNRMEICRTVPS